MEKRRLELIEAECRRHAALARVDAARRAELLEIQRVCRKVPLHPAESFREALQSCWFVCATSGRRSPYAYR